MSHRKHTLAALVIRRVLLLVFVEVQFISEADSSELHSTVAVGAGQRRKSDAVRQAHGSHARGITTMAMSMISRRLVRLALRLGLAIYVVGLVRSDLVQDGFQSALSNVDATLIFPLLLGPVVLVSRPELVRTVGILFLRANLLVGCFQPFLDLCSRIYSLVTLPG
jgi:hypothetical protein